VGKPLSVVALLLVACFGLASAGDNAAPIDVDVAVIGGTPGGLMAAIAAARESYSVVLLERSAHIGGLPANGLGATDITTRGATGDCSLNS
jgi:heterodisulfide reductase subunit A-like polyferredoxin